MEIAITNAVVIMTILAFTFSLYYRFGSKAFDVSIHNVKTPDFYACEDKGYIHIPRVPSLVSHKLVNMPTISKRELKDSARATEKDLLAIKTLEDKLLGLGFITQRNTPAFLHQLFFGKNAFAQTLADDGFIGLRVSQKMANLHPNMDIDQLNYGLMTFNLKDTVMNSVCKPLKPCTLTKYRSLDGSCNNLLNPTWGKSFTGFVRLLQPDYADGLGNPRIASDCGPLPSARLVSVTTSRDVNIPDRDLTLLIMQFAQFLDHDLSLASLTRGSNGSGIVCCEPEFLEKPELRHPACFEISIPEDDPFFSRYRETCMEFVRSAPAPRPGCTLGPREQLNQLTAFIDASTIYGSTEEQAKELRSGINGLLRSSCFGNTELLPPRTTVNEECQTPNNSRFSCFEAGDERVNEQINLAILHTIWMREHNRVAKLLAYYNPGWNDEILYQEARRIVGAEMQHIVFNEFLPLLLGKEVMRTFDLLLKPDGFSNCYNPLINPSIANGFASAAYRYGHSLVQGIIKMVDKTSTVVNELPLSSVFFNPMHMYSPGSVDNLLRGLFRQPAQQFDSFVTEQLTNHLFQPAGNNFGMDLIALNIQRGRDHGIPGYNAWREKCGLPRARNFEDLLMWMTPASVIAFESLYRNVDDIDLFPAGIAEHSLPGATLGPTFACIVAEQFRRLKLGDRFWFENGGLDTSFTEAQLREIRKSSLARIICDNSENIEKIQPVVFLQPEYRWNFLVSCDGHEIPRVDLKPWKSHMPCT
ncbi:salivary peroxidase/catechol oxidase-like [Tachypleus tridentatus]|uniref:salivary peroxidase/catechol oxidase-like n=1 Tax=Tachypleus tridentatus TaxID=6853 RepID=UPI003FD2C525